MLRNSERSKKGVKKGVAKIYRDTWETSYFSFKKGTVFAPYFVPQKSIIPQSDFVKNNVISTIFVKNGKNEGV